MNEDTMTIDALLDTLGNESNPLSAAAIYRLSGLSEDDENAVAEVWPHIPVERRWSLLTQLNETSEANFEVDFTSVARLALDDPDGGVRRRAIACLWEVKKPWLLDRLMTILEEDEATEVRAEATSALGRFILMGEFDELSPEHSTHVEDRLLEVFQEPAEALDVRRRALESLAYSSREVVCELIEEAYHDVDQQMRVSAVFAMGRNADSRWRTHVLHELNNPEQEMRYEAAHAAGELMLEDAVPALVELTYNHDVELRTTAIWSLGEIGGPEARRALNEAALMSENEDLLEVIDDALSMAALAEGVMGLIELGNLDDAEV